MLKWYFYGTVVFSSANRRTAASRRLDQRATRAGLVAEVWPDLITWFGSWPAGYAAITVDGLPALRFCYSVTDQAVAEELMNDVAAAWEVFQDSNSNWGTTVITVPG